MVLRRSLVLRRESLTELSDADLSGLAGAGPDYTSPNGFTCVLRDCLDSDFSDLVGCDTR